MPGPILHYTMIFTDQGMGNLITITSDKNPKKVLYSALVDFGSSRSRRTKESINFLTNYIDGRRADGAKLDFDLVIISHTDEDHWSLFPKILNHYGETKPLKIGKLFWGDEESNYNSYRSFSRKIADPYNVVTDLKKYVAGKLKETVPKSQFSKYDKASRFKEFDRFTIDDVLFSFVPVIGNAKSTKTKSDSNQPLITNTASICVGILKKDSSGTESLVVLPGDMTWETIGKIEKFGKATAELNRSLFLSCPHHGSRNTIAKDYSANNDLSPADTFAKLIDPQLLAISAGFMTHRHPFDSVIDALSPNVLSNEKDDEHDYVSYVEDKNSYRTTPSEKFIFTSYGKNLTKKTGYTSDTPWRVTADPDRWIFTIQDDQITISGVSPGKVPQPGLKNDPSR